MFISFILVALIPLITLGFNLYNAAWENAWREIYEKHRLLAMNLATPIKTFVLDKQRLLATLGGGLSDHIELGINNSQVGQHFKRAQAQLKDFDVVAMIDQVGQTRALITSHSEDHIPENFTSLFAESDLYLRALQTQEPQISGVRRSLISDRPTIFMAQPIVANGVVYAVLVAEMSLVEIERLRKNINFGVGGHSAMVDNLGHVVAHPNPDWAQEMKDLSHLDIVKKMLSGETGVTEFYSPFVKQNMVAGYTSVPGIHWGVMVPQPKGEVEDQVHGLLIQQFLWALTGFAIAIILAVVLGRRITRPMNNLADEAKKLMDNNYEGDLPVIDDAAPTEVIELNQSLVDLVSGMQQSRHEVRELNESLQERVEAATAQLKDANEKLQEALEEADNANGAKSRFLASMSHEFRTPLNAIIGYSDMLREDITQSCSTHMGEDLEKIQLSARHLLSLINDILDISKIEAGKMDLYPEQFEIYPLIKEIESTLELLVRKNNNVLQIKCPDDLGSMVTDLTKLRQILFNLLSNAAKFTEDGVISVEVVKETQGAEAWYSFIVKDTGIGISSLQMKELFLPFSQLESGVKAKYGGTGLGLSISRHFAHMMGGTVSVDSVEGEGTTFTVKLPARAPLSIASGDE
jgi:signal transduction histidine kinase